MTRRSQRGGCRERPAHHAPPAPPPPPPRLALAGTHGPPAPCGPVSDPTPPPVPRPHYLPRTGAGWTASILFLVLCALAQPPVVHGWANRVEPWILGVPFLYAYLLVVYVAMIAVLVWALSRGV